MILQQAEFQESCIGREISLQFEFTLTQPPGDSDLKVELDWPNIVRIIDTVQMLNVEGRRRGHDVGSRTP